MAVKKQVVNDADKALVLKALADAMHPDVGLTSTQVGWRCGKNGTQWGDTILEALLIDRRVVKERLITKDGRDVDNEPFTWRLP